MYIGIPSEMAGVVVALPAAGSAGGSAGYSVGAGEVNAATAGELILSSDLDERVELS